MSKATITDDQVLACYEAARSIGTTSRNARAKDVARETGMNLNTANHYIKAVEEMRQDGHYNMTVNPDATAQFLNRIGRDDGPEAKHRAARVVLAHVDYYATLPKGGGPQHAIRDLAQAILATTPFDGGLASGDPMMTLDAYENAMRSRMDEIENLPDDQLERRAHQAADAPPPRISLVTTAYDRNQSVKRWVLKRAAGICEGCAQPAPFNRKDETPYLEHHHRHPLAEGGHDTVANSLALCPNCHREAHHGQDGHRFLA